MGIKSSIMRRLHRSTRVDYLRQCWWAVAAVVVFAGYGTSAAQTTAAPGPDALKQALTKRLVDLKPAGVTERNVLFQSVVAGKGSGGTYPFTVMMLIRDYNPGYPPNHYYGDTCVAHVTGGVYELSLDQFGGWHAEGRMTPDMSQRECKPNTSAVSSIPLESLTGATAPAGPAAPAAKMPPPAAVAGGESGVAQGAYQCWSNGQARMLLNFTIAGAGQYTGSDNKPGTFSLDAATSRITFKGGALDGAMPDGYYALYHVVEGRPKVSFMSASTGSEAAFCQKKS
jgi:hypothetical protein